MRKLFFTIFALGLLAPALQADTVDAKVSYLWSNRINQGIASFTVKPSMLTEIGVAGRYVKDRNDYAYGRFKDPIYSVYLPMRLELELLDVELTPFYYFENDSAENASYQKASGYGATFALTVLMEDDQVNDIYTHARVGAAYAKQDGTLFKNNAAGENTSYAQAAYFLHLRQSLFQAYRFDVMGAAFQYPDGIKDVNAFRGVMNQQDLVSLQTLDVTRDLRKYSVGGRFTRTWQDKPSALYFGYSFTENYTADPDHSFLLGNSFLIVKNVYVDMAYNHLETSGHKNKRDVFYVSANFSF